MNPPESIGRYTIVSQLGKGGMAEVYLAEDTMMKRQVALKLLPKLFMHDPQFKSRFEREAQVVAQLEHPAVVTVYDFGYHDEQPYMVSRYMRGGSLLQRIQSQGAFSLEEAMEIVARVAGALDESHSRGIVHRDLKPANILFDEAGRAYVADFGIAKVIEATSAMTGNALIGTPAYMSPEQFGGEHELDGRSDEYALGIILFEMLSGELPFKGDTTAKLMKQHLMDAPVALSSLRGDVPGEIEAVLMRALAKDPGERFATLGEFASALAAATGSAPAGPGTRPAPIAAKEEREDIYATNLAPVTQVEVDVPDLGRSEDGSQQSAVGVFHPTRQTESGTPAGKKSMKPTIKHGLLAGAPVGLAILFYAIIWIPYSLGLLAGILSGYLIARNGSFHSKSEAARIGAAGGLIAGLLTYLSWIVPYPILLTYVAVNVAISAVSGAVVAYRLSTLKTDSESTARISGMKVGLQVGAILGVTVLGFNFPPTIAWPAMGLFVGGVAGFLTWRDGGFDTAGGAARSGAVSGLIAGTLIVVPLIPYSMRIEVIPISALCGAATAAFLVRRKGGPQAGKKKQGSWVGCLMALVITGVVVIGLGMAGRGDSLAILLSGIWSRVLCQNSARPMANSGSVIGGGTGWLIFAVYDDDGNDPQIFRIFHDGSGLEYLASGDPVVWLPDGTRIAFMAGNLVYTMAGDGSDITQVDFYPKWHPSTESCGDESLWEGSEASNANNDIYLTPTIPWWSRNLTIDSGSDNFNPAFSPDGQKIAFQSNRGRGRSEYHIYVMDRDGKNVQQLTTGPGTYVAPSWSPDGEWIAFLGNESTSGYYNVGTTLYIMRADGSDLTEVVTDTPVYYYSSPSWQP